MTSLCALNGGASSESKWKDMHRFFRVLQMEGDKG